MVTVGKTSISTRWQPTRGDLLQDRRPPTTRVGKGRDVVASQGDHEPGAVGGTGPEDLLHLDADPVDGVHGPEDVEVGVLLQALSVHDRNFALPLYDPLGELLTIDELILAARPEGEGRKGLLAVPDLLRVLQDGAKERKVAHPPSHRLGRDVDRTELKESRLQPSVPQRIRPAEKKAEDQVAHLAVPGAWQDALERHHDWNERVNAKEDTETLRA